jgi:hypothetical protein
MWRNMGSKPTGWFKNTASKDSSSRRVTGVFLPPKKLSRNEKRDKKDDVSEDGEEVESSKRSEVVQEIDGLMANPNSEYGKNEQNTGAVHDKDSDTA